MLLTAEDIRTNVGGAAPLVLQQVIFTHQMLPKTEVGDRNSVGPEAKTESEWKCREKLERIQGRATKAIQDPETD